MNPLALFTPERQNFEQRFLIQVSSGIVVKLDLECSHANSIFGIVLSLLLLT